MGDVMREQLLTFLLDRALPHASSDEDFFSAGPCVATRQSIDDDRRAALLTDIRRQHGRSVRQRAHAA